MLITLALSSAPAAFHPAEGKVLVEETTPRAALYLFMGRKLWKVPWTTTVTQPAAPESQLGASQHDSMSLSQHPQRQDSQRREPRLRGQELARQDHTSNKGRARPEALTPKFLLFPPFAAPKSLGILHFRVKTPICPSFISFTSSNPSGIFQQEPPKGPSDFRDSLGQWERREGDLGPPQLGSHCHRAISHAL